MTTNRSKRFLGETWQGEDERISYTCDTTKWGGYQSGAVCTLKDSAGNDLSGSKLNGVVSVNNNVITSPLVISLADGTDYRLEFKWVVAGLTLESYLIIHGEE
jgi:hypothetical protein